jgi:hypothetical protein
VLRRIEEALKVVEQAPRDASVANEATSNVLGAK